MPGSGKSTLGDAVSQRINEIYVQQQLESTAKNDEPVAVAMPMDGFHLTRAQLAAMPNAAEAIHRRGAAFTFDGKGFLALIRRLSEGGTETVHAPSFDHAVKDPVDNAIAISPAQRIVLVEGNYCALNRKPWSDAAALMSELWYVDVPKEVVWERLAKRHLASGIVADADEARERAQGTDELNAEDVRNNMLKPDEVLRMC